MTARKKPSKPPTVVVQVGATGGSLKSTISAAQAHVYAERGYSVTVVDLDPQGSLTLRSGLERAENPLTAPPERVEYGRPPASPAAFIPEALMFRGGRALEAATLGSIAEHLRRATAAATTECLPDFVMVDTPPALGPITQAAMRSASIIIVPSNPTMEGIYGARDVLELYRKLNLSVPIHVVLTRVLYLGREIAEEFRRILDGESPFADFPSLRLEVEIPYSRSGAEASLFSLPVMASAPDDRASVAYRRLATKTADTLGLQLRQRRLRSACEVEQPSVAASQVHEVAP